MSQTFSSPLSFTNTSIKPVQDAYPGVLSSSTQPILPTAMSSLHAGPSTWRPPAHWNLAQNQPPAKKAAPRKNRTQEESRISAQVAANVATCLAADQAAVTHPEVDTPFSDTLDIIKRLLPYHVYQQPSDDLHALIHGNVGKGKGKATHDDLNREIHETKFALECFKRRKKLEERFRKARLKSGRRSAPNDQAVFLAQAVLEGERADTVTLNNELRTARTELDRLEREKRVATNAQRTSYYMAQPVTPATTTTSRPYYHPYPYAYAYGAHVQPSSTSSFSVAPVTPAPAAPAATAPYQLGSAIPVQLPVSSLPALHQLGIVPVAPTSVTDGQPAPPAVLRGSSANGTMLSLEINVSVLQSSQMSGLAVILNSLMSRSTSSSSSSSSSGGSTAVPAISVQGTGGPMPTTASAAGSATFGASSQGASRS
ncbi:uncharacterized protein BT62DRAFT_938455 [Guyanagaster necrorhizus]|uniref:GLTSCR protein conserved domain-containing protein n=1 Tax=Guyanagaster necrorhizus TaxID=856835 RepID=A0A9P8ALV6_9AGAR|nr:uncharacterized protein BT62DRAFT_938455 [Guyanagaster necrorhizus MCA 3950]KAG7440031.1 hypothetical protein BT62DRAFT_938455 [Guyanagaster necrorhizus MCA 3950]